jgi:small-conductance mechanosensitive channel
MNIRTIAVLFALALTPSAAIQAATPAPTPAAPAAKAAESPAATAPAAPATPPAKEVLPSVPAPTYPSAIASLNGWKQTLDSAEWQLQLGMTDETRLNQIRDEVTEAQTGARDLIASTTPRLNEATARAAELAPDEKDTTPQSDEVKLERAKLLAEISARQSIVQQANLINVRAQQSLDLVSERRRARFTDTVFKRSPSLINPSFWMSVAAAIPPATTRLIELASRWIGVMTDQPLRAASGFAIAVVVLLGFFLSPWRRWQARWTTRDAVITEPTALRKTSSAAVIVLANTLIPGTCLLVLYQALVALGVLPDEISAIARPLFVVITFAFFFYSLATATLAPERPAWRLIDLDDEVVGKLVPVAALLGIAACFGVLLQGLNRAIGAPAELSAASEGLVALTKAFLFMAALRITAHTGNEYDKEEESTAAAVKRSAWRLLIPLGWLLAATAVLGPLAGFVSFGGFVAGEMILVVVVLMAAVLLSRFADALIASTFSYYGTVGRFLRQTAGLSSPAVRQIAALLNGFVQLVLIGFAVFVVLATWGINSDDVFGSLSSAFFGFSIGKFTISPSAILGAIFVLIIGIAATRAIQGWLESRFLPETNLDLGVRSSIRTGVGYIGIILATIVALSYVGLNLQNIAIVAGALSVGIGFGLQSIINNFVSGLILLVERPIKVGDRIEVGTRMGVVKRINVRATEIATYDNVSVIVPNADLISGQVVNWMHGSYTARLSVNVGTSYTADADHVIAVLLDIVNGHPRALKSPEPFAILGNFGADALEFTVFFHVANIGADAGVANDVRLEIFRRFRKEGIEIPFAQRDLHIRDLDRIEAMVRSVSGGSRSDSGPEKIETAGIDHAKPDNGKTDHTKTDRAKSDHSKADSVKGDGARTGKESRQ